MAASDDDAARARSALLIEGYGALAALRDGVEPAAVVATLTRELDEARADAAARGRELHQPLELQEVQTSTLDAQFKRRDAEHSRVLQQAVIYKLQATRCKPHAASHTLQATPCKLRATTQR